MEQIYSTEEFQELVLSGGIKDDDGKAYLIIDDELAPGYNIYIDSQVVTRSGTLISFWGILKMYDRERLKIMVDWKERNIMSQQEWASMYKNKNKDYQ